jgi:hypothetical protein
MHQRKQRTDTVARHMADDEGQVWKGPERWIDQVWAAVALVIEEGPAFRAEVYHDRHTQLSTVVASSNALKA